MSQSVDHQHGDASVQGTVSHSYSPLQSFRSITMEDVLEQDPRPAFVLDLEDENIGDKVLHFVFQNRALRNSDLEDVLSGVVPPNTYGQSSHQTYSAFHKWALNGTAQQDSAFLYHGITWTGATINNRWRMVNGIKERQQRRMTGAFATASWGPTAIPVIPSG
jgi:hypothetical protein